MLRNAMQNLQIVIVLFAIVSFTSHKTFHYIKNPQSLLSYTEVIGRSLYGRRIGYCMWLIEWH